MRVSLFGLGPVGCVTAACLAHDGHQILALDVDQRKIASLAAGHATACEPGLDELVAEGVATGNLRVSNDAVRAVLDSDVSLICVGTPSDGNGKIGLDQVQNVAGVIGSAMQRKAGYHAVVVRSTVIPGTTDDKLIPLIERESGRRAGSDFGVAMNPEFLREGSAVADYYHPCHVIVGELDKRSGDVVEHLCRAVSAPVVRTTIRSAEMLKYANNAFHALKIAFANEIGDLCEMQQIDGHEVMHLLCCDTRLNVSPAYLRPGYAFGGPCLPKDLRALVYQAGALNLELPLLSAILPSNRLHIRRAVEMIEAQGRHSVGILGLSFKAGSDDLRESPVLPLVEALVAKGYRVSVYDEQVTPAVPASAQHTSTEQRLPQGVSSVCSSVEEVVAGADVIVITNNSRGYQRVPSLLRKDQVLLDLVRICTPDGNAPNS